MSVTTPSLSLAGVRFGYGATPILDGVDLDLADRKSTRLNSSH